jgi:hypothetical protein
MFLFLEVPWLAVILGTVSSMVIGFLWYGPLFGKLWMRLIDKSREELGAAGPLVYVGTGVAWLITSYVLALILTYAGAFSIVDGVISGLVVALGIAASQTFIYTSFGGPPKSVWALNAAYIAICLMITGGLINALV